MTILDLWTYLSRILLLIFLYFVGGNIGAKYFALRQNQGDNLHPELVEERMKFFIAQIFPFFFFSLLLAIWKFNLWSYLDYVLPLLILYVLGSFALQLILGSK